MTDKTPAMPDLTAVILWLENGCDPAEAVKELRHHQSKLKALAALQSAQPAAPSCVFGAVPLRPGDTLGPQTAACLTCGQPPACLSHPAESDRQQGLSITGAQPAAAVSDEEIRTVLLANGFTIKEGHTDLKPYVYAAARAILALRPQSSGFQNALDIRSSQGWKLNGQAVPVLYTDEINGRQVMRDDVWLCTTEALRPQADHPDTARCIKARNDLNAALHGEGALIDDLEHAVANVCAKLLRPQAVPMTRAQRLEVFRKAEDRMAHDINLCWRNALIEETEAHHGITQRADGGEQQA